MNIRTARETLPNGLTAVAIHRPEARTAIVSVDVRVGARYEHPDDAGLSHFLEHMVFQGCAGYPSPDAVNEASERLGSAIDACTSRSHTHFEHHVAVERLADSARLLAAVLSSPAFMSIETERGIILEEALDEFDEGGKCIDADTLSRRRIWPDVALGQSIIGELAHLKRIDIDDLRRHHAAFYGAANMVVSAVGPQPLDGLMDIVREAFACLPTGERQIPASPAAAVGGPIVDLVRDHRSQCDARLLIRTPGHTDPAAPALALLRIALDDGLASRMHRRLGAELGLAYDQWALWEDYPDTGVFELGAQVSPGKVSTFYDEALGLLGGLADRPPSGDELERVRFRAHWGMQSALETPEGLVALYGTPHLWWRTPPTPADYLARLDAVGTEALGRVARTLLDPERMVACCIGPLDRTSRRLVRARLKRRGDTD